MNRIFPNVQRREFLKASAATAVGAVLASRGLYAPQEADAETHRRLPHDFVTKVRPMVGTGWRGHTFPGAVAPFGLMQLSPDTAGPPEPRWNARGDYTGWEHDSGYHYPDDVVLGFSHTHLQGVGGSDMGDVLLMPVVEGKNWSWDAGAPRDQAEMQMHALRQDSGWVFGADPGYRSLFSPAREESRAGYYRVHLDTPDVQAELTTTTRCGMHRYHYPALPANTRQGVLLDLVHGVGGRVYSAELTIESPTRIRGKRFTHGWAADKQVYFVMEFSQPITAWQLNVDGKVTSPAVGGTYSGKEMKAIFSHAPGAQPLVIRVGLSCTGLEGAAKNLAAEIPGWDFDGVVRQAEQAWAKALGALDAELPSAALAETFYTGAYHGLVAPATFNDVDGTYRGQDHQNHPNPGFTRYTILSIWDIYRGEFPFLTLMQPQRTNDIIRTLLVDYDQLGLRSLPMWTLWGNETYSMGGFHAAAMIVGAYTRGFRGFDIENAYTAIRDSALVGPVGNKNSELRVDFRKHGYYPMRPHGPASISVTLDLSYDYWCAGAMAELLGKHDDAAMFYKFAQSYRNVFDPATGFMRGKSEDGKWREPFQPDREIDDYVEADAWQASFAVPHDVQGLIELFGGDAAFIAKLDAMFTAPSYVYDVRPDVTGMVGQDAQGNEPSNHHPYLYSFAGAPWKTQYWVRKVAALYNNTPAGIPGNDDCGQLSSWFVFAALGFYPVNAATGVYVIGSPMVNRATLENTAAGTRFTIVAENNSAENVYIASAHLNGKPLTRAWLTHAEIVAGGELRFRMSSQPNKEWGSAVANRPPSGLLKG